MRRVLFLAALSTFVLSATIASAQVYNWTGAYVGAQLGGGTGHTDWEYTGGGSVDHSIGGLLGGGHLGYNHQFANNIVVGLETEMNGGDVEGERSCPNPAFSCNSAIRWLGSTRARAGFVVDRFLPYLTTGVAYGGVRITTNNPATVGLNGETTSRVGWTGGAGAAVAFTDRISGRFEYAFYQLARGTSTVDFGLRVRSRVEAHTFRAGVSWKFFTP